MDDGVPPSDLLDEIAARGGLATGVAKDVSRALGIPEAEVYGTGSFFHLVSDPDTRVRVCQGLSCRLQGSRALLDEVRRGDVQASGCSCLAACDRAPAVLVDRTVLEGVTAQDLIAARNELDQLVEARGVPSAAVVGPSNTDPRQSVYQLTAAPDFAGSAFVRAQSLGAQGVVDLLERSGLQGRGGAGFLAARKWASVRAQSERTRFVVLNADEGEPGTFKDRELVVRRPDLVLEGLAIAAHTVEASDVYCYLRGEFRAPAAALTAALGEVERRGCFEGIRFHVHHGHGAYICGEETALLEALEGRRGMPRLKPPYPTEAGLFGKPTLIHNVETIAAVPAIVNRGAEWFRALGRTAPGTKLYSVSGHVARPGVYELPLGITLDELVDAAGGYVGELLAFSPGGASSGFLPASERHRPLDFEALRKAGSMLGSAGVVVLNDSADLLRAARQQLRFFEVESCGQCAPCRIGTRYQREALERFISTRDPVALDHVEEVAWEMNEGSICGLGQAASSPLTSILEHFREAFRDG